MKDKMWCIPPKSNAAFVCAMEEVLGVYHRPYDAKNPWVNMDELIVQLVGESRKPLPIKPGQPRIYDYEYKRNGTANIFMFTEPLAGWRKAVVTDQRTAVDWAHQVKRLLDKDYPDAEKVTLVMDNLNTHKPASLYEAFKPTVARKLLDRLEFVYTPKHGSWMNIAEIELNVLTRQCLSRRIENKRELIKEVNAWAKKRNKEQRGVDWRFTTKDARIKLKKLYPTIQS